MSTFPLSRKYESGLSADFYTTRETFVDEALNDALASFGQIAEILSPLVVLPDVSHKAERISPTGLTLATRGAIVPAAVPAANGSGVRVARLDLRAEDCSSEMIQTFLQQVAARIPIYGADSPGLLRPRLRDEDLLAIYRGGLPWLNERLQLDEPLERIESGGLFPVGSSSPQDLRAHVPDYLYEQGLHCLGILETGNHFIELQFVDEIIDTVAAELNGLEVGQAILMIHDGNPASLVGQYFQPVPYAKEAEREAFHDDKAAFHDRLKAIDPAHPSARYFSPSTPYFAIETSDEAHAHFLTLMGMACNFGLSNRAYLQHSVLEAMRVATQRPDLACETLTDTLHDCVKETEIDGHNYCVHRHGASEARPADTYATDHPFSQTGQLFGVPGAPGRRSVLAAAKDTRSTWYTANHGAGRRLDRSMARKRFEEKATFQAVRDSGAAFERRGLGVFAGEHPSAYKDIESVLSLAEDANLLRGIALLRPAAIFKG